MTSAGRHGSPGSTGVVLITLLALSLARAALAFVPSMWGWGLDAQRFLVPLAAWLPWGVTLALLHPAVGAAAAGPLERWGSVRLGGRWATWTTGIAAALLVWSLPDRSWFTGDFLLRQGVAETAAVPASFAQSLPLEVFLARTLPRLLAAGTQLDPNAGARLVGALAAGALAVIASALTRAWGWRGPAATVAMAIIFFGGYLACFTGLGKPAAVLCVLAALALLGGTRLASAGRGGAILGFAIGLALLVHRSALALLPLWLVSLALAWRAHRPLRGGTRVQFWLALALPAIAAYVALPLIARIVREFDLPRHLLPPAIMGPGGPGPLAAAFAPLHLVDLANLLLFYTPALLPAAALMVTRGARGPAGPERLLPAVLALSFLPLLLFVHPIQGMVRDLDVFAPAGLALALLCAHIVGAALAGGRLRSWLAPVLIAAVALPALQWLLHFHDPERGLDRARALALEAPARPDAERAQIWDAITYRAFRERRWDRAVEASAHSVRYAPHPRALIMFAIARTYTGDHRGAESLYVALAEHTPDDPLVWVGLGGAALRIGDSAQAARALARLNGLAPGGREARLVRRHLRAFPEVWPTARAVVGGETDATGR